MNVAPNGTKIIVCKGTYHQSVAIPASKHHLNIMGDTGSVISPTPPAATVPDTQGGYPIVAIVRVAPGAIGTDISGLKINGAGIEAAVNGCGTDLIGLLYQATAGHSASGTAEMNNVVNTTPTNAGCGSGLGIEVEAGTNGYGLGDAPPELGLRVRQERDHLRWYRSQLQHHLQHDHERTDRTGCPKRGAGRIRRSRLRHCAT